LSKNIMVYTSLGDNEEVARIDLDTNLARPPGVYIASRLDPVLFSAPMFKMRFHNFSTSDFINVEFMDMILPDGKLLNSEFLNGENISLSNRKAVSKNFMELG
jgi:hypothetical protein